jgi:hypothetical protein
MRLINFSRRVDNMTHTSRRQRVLFNSDLKHLLQDFENAKIALKEYLQGSCLLVAKNDKAKE